MLIKVFWQVVLYFIYNICLCLTNALHTEKYREFQARFSLFFILFLLFLFFILFLFIYFLFRTLEICIYIVDTFTGMLTTLERTSTGGVLGTLSPSWRAAPSTPRAGQEPPTSPGRDPGGPTSLSNLSPATRLSLTEAQSGQTFLCKKILFPIEYDLSFI